MATELKVPSVGESITEVTIAKWIKTDGDYVEMDEIICELESEKATFELNAESSGILKTKVAEGETIEIGTVIGLIEENGQSKSDKATANKQKEVDLKSAGQEKTGEILEMKVPSVGESITEVTISSWVKNEGDYVELDEVIAEIESDKATFELTAETGGILHQIAKEGDTLEINALICIIEEVKGGKPQEKVAEQISKDKKIAISEPSDRTYAYGHPSPAAAKLMTEKGIKQDEIDGTGPRGRIIKEDVLHFEPSIKKSPQKEETVVGISDDGTDQIGRTERREKLSQLRKTISKRLVSVKNETAMLTTFNEVNMDLIMSLRKKYKEKFKERYEVNLGFMSFFSKACCIALHEWPSLNASIDGEEIIYHDFIDISIAVSAPKGLVVPVIRNAEKLSFAEIEKEVLLLATKARENKLSIEEMTGGTFTITNGGVFGSMLSTPIINAPQSAILGMHNIVERPVVENGDIRIRPIMYLALSYDHRIIDGRESVSFLFRLKELLEDPTRLLLEI